MSKIKPFEVTKPWGSFRQFTYNEVSTVKIISVKKDETFSLQYHSKRTEFWKILSGTPELVIGERTILAKPGDEFEIPAGTHHRAGALGQNAEILEICVGEFDEKDIVRIEDKYGRI